MTSRAWGLTTPDQQGLALSPLSVLPSAHVNCVGVLILDRLYESLPQPPFTEGDIEHVSESVYNFVWSKSANHTAAWA